MDVPWQEIESWDLEHGTSMCELEVVHSTTKKSNTKTKQKAHALSRGQERALEPYRETSLPAALEAEIRLWAWAWAWAWVEHWTRADTGVVRSPCVTVHSV